MSKTLPKIITSSDTFGSLVSKINALFDFANNEVVSANSTGALTIGTGFVQGLFGANTLSTSSLGGGNTSASGNLAITTNTAFQSNVVANTGLLVGGAGVMSVNAFSYSTTNTDPQVVDSFPVASWRSGKYVISITDPATPKYQSTEILVLQDGANAYTTEYATLAPGGSIASFSADVSAGNCRILVTPGTAVIQLKVNRSLNAA